MSTDDKKKNDKDEELKEELIDEAEKEELILEADEEIEDLEEESSEGDDKVSVDFKNLEAQLKRAVADYQNLEKRTQEGRREWII